MGKMAHSSTSQARLAGNLSLQLRSASCQALRFRYSSTGSMIKKQVIWNFYIKSGELQKNSLYFFMKLKNEDTNPVEEDI